VPLSLAREALEKSNNNIDSALSYLDTSSSSGASKKAAKVAGRPTGEGVIAISLLGGKRVAMVHVGCETDFVARNEVFLATARGIAGTTAFLDVPGEGEAASASASASDPPSPADPIQTFPVSSLLSAPLIALPSTSAPTDEPEPVPTPDPTTVSQHLLSSLSQTGENLRLLRAVSFAAPFPSSAHIRFVPGAYAHGGPSSTEGKVGGVVVISAESTTDKPMAARVHGAGGDVLEADLLALARTLARQVVGFPTARIGAPSEAERGEGAVEEESLVCQQAMMFGKQETVGEVVRAWGDERGLKVEIVGMRRWAVGDALEEQASA
jgi:elongation factor Ts